MLDFLVLGTEKCGSNSLRHYLNQHPAIFASVRGHYFLTGDRPLTWKGPRVDTLTDQFIYDFETYRSQWANVPSGMRVGEVATLYLYDDAAPGRIAHVAPGARLIAILRDPAERAYSNYAMMVRDGREPSPSFEEALALEPRRRAEGWGMSWHYEAKGYYHGQLQTVLRSFEPDRLRVYLYEDFVSDPLQVLRDLFGFLNVDPTFEPDLRARFNISGTPRLPALYRFLSDREHPLKKHVIRRLLPARLRSAFVRSVPFRRLVNAGLRRPTGLRPETRARLVAGYRDDILALQDYLGRSLASWLS